ncbi:unnamed protein product [Musa banksii]
MADNCSVLDPWVYHSESAWISEVSARENAVVAMALRSPSPTPPPHPPPPPPPPPPTPFLPLLLLPSCSSASGDATLRRRNALGPAPAGAGLEEEVARVEAVGHHLHLRRPDRLPGGGAAGDGVPARGGATGEARAGTVCGGRPGGPATDPPAHARHLGVFSGYGRGRDPERGLLVRVTTTCLRAGLRLRSTTPGLPYAGFVGCHVEEMLL